MVHRTYTLDSRSEVEHEVGILIVSRPKKWGVLTAAIHLLFVFASLRVTKRSLAKSPSRNVANPDGNIQMRIFSTTRASSTPVNR